MPTPRLDEKKGEYPLAAKKYVYAIEEVRASKWNQEPEYTSLWVRSTRLAVPADASLPPDTLQKIYTEPVSEEVREFVIHSRKAASLANEILKAALPMKQLALGTLLNYPEIGLITGVPECPMAVGHFFFVSSFPDGLNPLPGQMEPCSLERTTSPERSKTPGRGFRPSVFHPSVSNT